MGGVKTKLSFIYLFIFIFFIQRWTMVPLEAMAGWHLDDEAFIIKTKLLFIYLFFIPRWSMAPVKATAAGASRPE